MSDRKCRGLFTGACEVMTCGSDIRLLATRYSILTTFTPLRGVALPLLWGMLAFPYVARDEKAAGVQPDRLINQP